MFSEKKKMDIFAESPSPPKDNKGKLTASEAATVMAAKWKMQIGSVASRSVEVKILLYSENPGLLAFA